MNESDVPVPSEFEFVSCRYVFEIMFTCPAKVLLPLSVVYVVVFIPKN